MLRYITLTGAGEKTNFAKMAALSKKAPLIEWGILYDETLAGTNPRYPSLTWIENFAKKASQKGMNISLHLCGKIAKSLLQNSHQAAKDEEIRLYALMERFDRVQLNMSLRANTGDKISHFRDRISCFKTKLERTEKRTRLILQWHGGTKEFLKNERHYLGTELLLDYSGGRGVSPASWKDLVDEMESHHAFGYAGGLTPANIKESVKQFYVLSKGWPFSVDAETGLRNAKDQFDLDICEEFVTNAYLARYEVLKKHCEQFGKKRVKIDKLSSFWIDWWLSTIEYNMEAIVFPPKDHYKVTVLLRSSNQYFGYSPDIMGLLNSEQIALLPSGQGKWKAFWMQDPSHQYTGETLEEAGARAVIGKYYRNESADGTLPLNMFLHTDIERRLRIH